MGNCDVISKPLVMDAAQLDSFYLVPNYPRHDGRALLSSPLDKKTGKIVLIVLCSVIGALILALLLWLIIALCKRRKSAPVVPATGGAAASKGADVEQGMQQNKPVHSAAPPAQEVPAAVSPVPVPVGAAPAAPTAPPVAQPPPTRYPPGIVLSPEIPPAINQFCSNRRLETEPPYERLVLISSRVHNAEMVAGAVLPSNAYVVYDWKNATLQELLLYIKKTLGSQKVTSVAVVAPGNKPGKVSLLEGSGTTVEKLAAKTELSQFWRVLAGFVALSGTADGRRVDLVGCGVVEAPTEGAKLLKELWNLTTVPFAAADDVLDGYKLCTFMEEPMTKQASIISTTIPALDLYFDRVKLFAVPPPGAPIAVAGAPAAAGVGLGAVAAVAASAPLPPGPPPPHAMVPFGGAPPLQQQQQQQQLGFPTPAPAALAAAAPAATAAAAAAAAPTAAAALLPPGSGSKSVAIEGQDIFSRLQRALDAHGTTAAAAFGEFDRNGDSQLEAAELTALVAKYVPDATSLDVKHFQMMVDMDAKETDAPNVYKISREEFVQGLPENVELQALVRERRDDNEVLKRLHEYLTGHEQRMLATFKEYDADSSGCLDHRELGSLVASIPGLDPWECKFILTYLYQRDDNRDAKISLQELVAALEEFPHTQPAVARAVPPSAGVGAGAAAGLGAAGAGLGTAAAGLGSAAADQAQASQAALQAQGQAAGQALAAHGHEAVGQAGQAARAVEGQAHAAAGQAAQDLERQAQAATGQANQAAEAVAGQASQAGQAALGQANEAAQAAAGQANQAAEAAAGQAQDAVNGAAAQAQAGITTAAGSLPPLNLTPPLAPLGPPRSQLAPLAPLGGRLGPLAPLNGLPRAGSLGALR